MLIRPNIVNIVGVHTLLRRGESLELQQELCIPASVQVRPDLHREWVLDLCNAEPGDCVPTVWQHPNFTSILWTLK